MTDASSPSTSSSCSRPKQAMLGSSTPPITSPPASPATATRNPSPSRKPTPASKSLGPEAIASTDRPSSTPIATAAASSAIRCTMTKSSVFSLDPSASRDYRPQPGQRRLRLFECGAPPVTCRADFVARRGGRSAAPRRPLAPPSEWHKHRSWIFVGVQCRCSTCCSALGRRSRAGHLSGSHLRWDRARQLGVGQHSKRHWRRGSAAHFGRNLVCFAGARLVDADAEGQRSPSETSTPR